MILEYANLSVKPDQTEEFERTVAQVRHLFEPIDGFRRLELRPSIETEGRYLLQVWWDSLEAHTVIFRNSPQFQEWRAALYHFYEAPPQLEHYGDPL